MTKDELKLAFQKAFQMGQDYWYHANHEFESYNKKSDAIKEKFNEMVKETIEEALAQPEQNWKTPPQEDAPLVKWAKEQEHNFCPRCGKRTADLTTIHTCTPPQENT